MGWRGREFQVPGFEVWVYTTYIWIPVLGGRRLEYREGVGVVGRVFLFFGLREGYAFRANLPRNFIMEVSGIRRYRPARGVRASNGEGDRCLNLGRIPGVYVMVQGTLDSRVR